MRGRKITAHLRTRAIALRKAGRSYSEIVDSLNGNVNKSTLSGWLKNIELSNKQRARLLKKETLNRKMFSKAAAASGAAKRRTAQAARKVLLDDARQEFKDVVLTTDAATLVGAALYWAEGSKTKCGFRLVNTDPVLIRFFVVWCRKILKARRDEITVRLQVYLTNGLTYNDIVDYWSDVIDVPKTAFRKPTINPNKCGSTCKTKTGVTGLRPYGIVSVTVRHAQKYRAKFFALLEKLWADSSYFVDVG